MLLMRSTRKPLMNAATVGSSSSKPLQALSFFRRHDIL